jgi:hypothetical protein
MSGHAKTTMAMFRVTSLPKVCICSLSDVATYCNYVPNKHTAIMEL